mgnify:FL=1
MTDGLHWIDYTIIALYACGMLGIGWFYGRRQSNTEEYFVGNRAMPPLLIGISLFATLFSTITYLATPGEIIKHGPATLCGVLAIPLAYYLVGYLLVPVYMRNRVTSAYELLEVRLGLRARMVGAVLFILLRLIWMALLIFLASKALLAMIGLDESELIYVIALTGGVAVGYSSIGGLRAVVITDLLQFLLLFGGMLLVLFMVTLRMGGFEWVPTEWNSSWDSQPVWPTSPTIRVTVVGSIIHGALWWFCTAGGDQTAVQRFMATKDASAARRSFLFNSIAGAAVNIALVFVGFALLGYYQADPSRLPQDPAVAARADLWFPYFISHHLPIGLSGLIVSGMFAAAMSSLDSGTNSITAVVMTDFVGRFRSQPPSPTAQVRLASSIAVLVGVTVITVSAFMRHVPGNFLEMSQRTQGLVVVPIFVLFFMALFVPRSTEIGALAACIASMVTAVLVAYWKQLAEAVLWMIRGSSEEFDPLSFQWINPVSLAVGVAVGWIVSLASRALLGEPSSGSPSE